MTTLLHRGFYYMGLLLHGIFNGHGRSPLFVAMAYGVAIIAETEPWLYGVIITWLFLQTNENAQGMPAM